MRIMTALSIIGIVFLCFVVARLRNAPTGVHNGQRTDENIFRQKIMVKNQTGSLIVPSNDGCYQISIGDSLIVSLGTDPSRELRVETHSLSENDPDGRVNLSYSTNDKSYAFSGGTEIRFSSRYPFGAPHSVIGGDQRTGVVGYHLEKDASNLVLGIKTFGGDGMEKQIETFMSDNQPIQQGVGSLVVRIALQNSDSP